MIILLCVVYLCLKMYPRSLKDIIDCDKKYLTNIACSISVCELNNDAKSSIKQYELQPLEKDTQEFDEIADILYGTTYFPDLRNLLPWTMTSVDADSEYDGITANILLAWGNDAADSCYISFLGENLVSVSLNEEDGFFIFHPSDTEVFNELVTYIKLHGTEK